MSENKKYRFLFKPIGVDPNDLPGADFAEKARMASKIKEKNKEVFNRVGFRYIYVRLLEGGYFDESGMNKVRSMKRASFKEAAFILSLENALK